MSKTVSDARSRNMSAIKNRDTKIELVLRKKLYQKGYRYRKNYSVLPGKPDIAITKYKIAVFCDSEFFHGKDWDSLRKQLEKGNNPEFWINKIGNNIKHDKEVDKKLKAMGWTVLRFWGKDIKKNTDECIKTIEEAIFNKTILSNSDE